MNRRIFYIIAGTGTFVCGAVLEERYGLIISLTSTGDHLATRISTAGPMSLAGLAFAGGLLLVLAGIKLLERRRFPWFRPERPFNHYKSTPSEGKISFVNRI